MDDLPWKLRGFDIHIRIGCFWPALKIHAGKVWKLKKPTKIDIGGYEATISEKHSLPPA